MTKAYLGKVHGQTIQIQEELGIADGAEVEVIVSQMKPPPIWGEGIRRSSGGATGVHGFDEAFSQIERERKAAQLREGVQ